MFCKLCKLDFGLLKWASILPWNCGQIFFSSGQYIVPNPNPISCDSTISIDLTINNSSSSTITEVSCNSYIAPDNQVFTSSGQYVVVIPNSVGCDSVITLNLTINNVNNGITNNSPTLIATATGASYQWLDCDSNYALIAGETNQNFTASINGNYAVVVTQNGCTDTSTCETVNNVSILENSFIVIPKLFPNPTTGELTLELENAYDNITINVKTVNGKLVSTQDYKSTKNITFEIKKATGIYIIEVSNQQGDSAKLRVIKK